jgi:hypothetical protein
MTMEKKVYYINSTNKINGTHSNFLYKVSIPPNASFTHCSLIQASIPKSYYLVQETQNTFTLDENGTTYTITIPVGNYTRASFVTQLSTQLNATGDWTYVVSVPDTNGGDPETGLITFTTYLYLYRLSL